MISSELEFVISYIERAEWPEDIFGNDPNQAKREYLRMARSVHPDRYTSEEDKKAATNGFTELQECWRMAETRIAAKVYGQRTVKTPKKVDASPLVTLSRGSKTYLITRMRGSDYFSNFYDCTVKEGDAERKAIFRVCQSPGDNDLIQREAEALKQFQAEPVEKFNPYKQTLIDTFFYRDANDNIRRRANILTDAEGLLPLSEIVGLFPDGLDAKDLAWMWRRILVALGFSHQKGVIHGGVVEPNILVQTEQHGIMLINWECSVRGEGKIPLMVEGYEENYPPEVEKKENVSPATDIYMAAKAVSKHLNSDTPPQIARFFRGCTLPSPSQRPQDAWSLLEEYDSLLERVYGGPRKFRPFVMPSMAR